MAEHLGSTLERRWLIEESQAPGVYGWTLGASGDWRVADVPAPYHVQASATVYGSLDDLAALACALLEDIVAIWASEGEAG